MKFDVIEQNGVEAKIKIDIPAKEVSETFKTVLRAVARQVKVPGFRPGKAPKGVLMQYVGEESLKQEAKEHLVEKSFAEALKELKLVPVNVAVEAELPTDGEDYSYVAKLELYPDIKLPDLKEIIIDTDKEEVDELELEQNLKELQEKNAILVPVERPVKKDDYLMVEIVREGETENSSLPIDLARVSEDFAEQFIGKKVDDILEIDLDVPEGEEAVKLNVKINDIKEKELPELNDDFAKDLGLAGFDELKENIRLAIQAEKDKESLNAQKEELIEKLIAETDFELPKSLVERRRLSMIEDLKKDLNKDAITFEDYIKQAYDGKEEAFEKEISETASERVRRDLVLEQLLTDRKTTVSNKEFEAAINYMAAGYGKKAKLFKKEMGKNWLENYRFLLERDKALNEALAEVLEANKEQDEEEKAETKAEDKKEGSKAKTTEQIKAKKTVKKAAKKSTSKTTNKAKKETNKEE